MSDWLKPTDRDKAIYLEGVIKGMEEAISSVLIGMGTASGKKPSDLIEEKRKEYHKKHRELIDKDIENK